MTSPAGTHDRPEDPPGRPDPADEVDGRSWRSRVWHHSLTRFLGFAAFGFAFDVTLLAILRTYTDLPRPAAVSIAFWVTYILNFFLNRYFAFDAAHANLSGQLGRYIPQVLVDYGLTVFGVELYSGLLTGVGMEQGTAEIVARIVAGATNAIFNYTVFRWWTFRNSPHGGHDPEHRPEAGGEPVTSVDRR